MSPFDQLTSLLFNTAFTLFSALINTFFSSFIGPFFDALAALLGLSSSP